MVLPKMQEILQKDRELTEQDMAVDYETTYWLLDRGWSNDEAAFCGGEH